MPAEFLVRRGDIDESRAEIDSSARASRADLRNRMITTNDHDRFAILDRVKQI
jgi:hypothetical protein